MLTSPSIYKTYSTKHPRLTNQTVLGVITIIGCIIAGVFAKPGQDIFETLSVGTGYVGLLLIVATLVIGPINMLRVRKNPVNINLRRDVGIWAGITSLGHVVFAALLQISWGDSLLGFFFNANGSPKLDLFGISDYFGLIAALVVLFLMVISNNYYLKKLKGKNWKNMQRFNYLLFVVVLAHTFTQQVNNERGMFLILGAIGLAVLVIIAQATGYVIYRNRSQVRNAVNVSASVPNRPVSRQGYNSSAPVTANRPNRPVSRQGYNSSAPVTANRPNRPVSRQAYNQPAPSSWPKIAIISVIGLVAIFFGFEIGHLGAEFAKNAGSSTNFNNGNNNFSNSGSSSGAQVNSPSFSQPQVRSRHS